MSQMGRLSANPFGTFRGNYLQRASPVQPAETNKLERSSTPGIVVESFFRDSDSGPNFDSPLPSSVGSIRSFRAFPSATHHTRWSMSNSYVASQTSSNPYFDSLVTLNSCASTVQSLYSSLPSQQHTNPFADARLDARLFVDPVGGHFGVQGIDRQPLASWVNEPGAISHFLAYLRRNSTLVQSSSDNEQ